MVKEKVDEVEKRKKKLEEEQKKLDKEQVEHPDDKIARAEAAADRIEAANKVGAQQIEELRTLQVNKALGGESDAGTAPPEEKEETPQEYKDRVMAGEIE